MATRSTQRFSPWKVGDKIWLKTTHLHLQYPSWKLSPKQLGPFEITQVLSLLTYKLQLPSTQKIHNVFHASLLSYHSTKPYGPTFSLSPPDILDNEEEYEVEATLSHNVPQNKRLYLTAWKGYPSSENTWEPEVNLHHSPTLLATYKSEFR